MAKIKKGEFQVFKAIKPLQTAMSLEEIEELLVKSILSGTLALHILRSSRKPVSKLMNELLDMEAQVGEFIGHAMQARRENQKRQAYMAHLLGLFHLYRFLGAEHLRLL